MNSPNDTNYAITANIYAHYMLNPPSEHSDSHVAFEYSNFSYIQITPLPNQTQSIFEVHIDDPREVFFEKTDQYQSYSEFQRFLLAMNLQLDRACVTFSKSSFMNHKVDLRPKIPVSPPIVKKIGNYHHAIMEDALFVIDSLHVGITIRQKLNETEILSIFKKLQCFNKDKSNSSIKSDTENSQMQKALDDYSRAMESLDVVSIFKFLYNTLESIVNVDGKDRKGIDFDNEVQSLIQTPFKTLRSGGVITIDINIQAGIQQNFRNIKKQRKI